MYIHFKMEKKYLFICFNNYHNKMFQNRFGKLLFICTPFYAIRGGILISHCPSVKNNMSAVTS